MRQQFARFVLVGLATNAALYAAYLLLTRSLLHPKTAMTVVYVAGGGLGFLGNRYWSFRHSSPAWGSFARYLAACAVGYAVNLTGLYVGVDRLGLPQEWVQGLMVFVVADDHVPAAEIRRVCRVAAGRQPDQDSDVIYRIPFN